jgi:hypothetical protein
MHKTAFLVFAALLPGLVAQTSAKATYEQFLAAQKPDDKDAAAAAAKALLQQHAALFAEGDGLYYRARLLLAARADWKEALAAYLAHAEARPDTALANDSLVLGAQLLHGQKKDFDGAGKLLARVKPDQLSERVKPTYESLMVWVPSDLAQAALIGKQAPDIKTLKVLQGPADMSLQSLRGKVVLLEFWATW